MTEQVERSTFAADGITAPLRHAVFRRIWLASLLSNLGLLIQGVGAAWAMTQMTSSADNVALVQTALMLPVMFISMPAGAIADMHDRRIVAMISLAISFSGAATLSVLFWFGEVTPNVLLALCFVVGSGMALFGPAWQSSVSEQVPAETLPSAVALNGISYNIERSFGPRDRRGRHRRQRRRGRSLRRQCDPVSAAVHRAVPVEADHVAVTAAARTAHPRHCLRRALHFQLHPRSASC